MTHVTATCPRRAKQITVRDDPGREINFKQKFWPESIQTSEHYPLLWTRKHALLPEFLSFRFLNTETITRTFPSTSTTVVKIKMLAKVAITQAGRVLLSSSGRPSSVLVRLCRRGSASGITTDGTTVGYRRHHHRCLEPGSRGTVLPDGAGNLAQSGNAAHGASQRHIGAHRVLWSPLSRQNNSFCLRCSKVGHTTPKQRSVGAISDRNFTLPSRAAGRVDAD